MTKGGGGVSQKMTIADEGGWGQCFFNLWSLKGAKYMEKEDNLTIYVKAKQ